MNEPESPPTIPWHYLSALVCLTRGTSVPKGVRASVTTNLLKKLLALDTAKLVEACAHDQTTATPDGLFSHVAALGTVAGKSYYVWTVGGAVDFPVLLRANVPRGEPFLSPMGVVVPWPLGQNDAPEEARIAGWAIAGRYANARRPDGTAPPAIPDADAEVSRTTSFPLRALMLAVDDAIDPDSLDRDEFERATQDADGGEADKKARTWLLERARLSPSTPLTVHVNTDLTTPMTRWEVRGTPPTLHIEMGWLKQNSLDKLLPKELVVNQWPCGAFQGFLYGDP